MTIHGGPGMRKAGDYVYQSDPPSDWMTVIQVMLIEVPGGKGGRILCTGAPPSMPPHVTKCIAFIKSRPQIFKVRPFTETAYHWHPYYRSQSAAAV